MEQVHGSDRTYMEKGLYELDETPGRLGELYEVSRRLDELEEQLGESDEVCLRTRRVV